MDIVPSTASAARRREYRRAVFFPLPPTSVDARVDVKRFFTFLPHAVNCAESSVFGAVSLWFLYVCMKCLWNRWTDLRQIHTEDAFGPSLGQVWKSKSKVKGQGHQGQKRHFLALSAACVRFMFRKTSLASRCYLVRGPPPRRAATPPGCEVLDLEHLRLSLRHGKPSQQGTGTFRAQDLSFPRTNSPYGELSFPRLFVPGNFRSLGTKVPGNESSLWRTKVLHRDLSFLGTKGLGYEKSVIPQQLLSSYTKLLVLQLMVYLKRSVCACAVYTSQISGGACATRSGPWLSFDSFSSLRRRQQRNRSRGQAAGRAERRNWCRPSGQSCSAISQRKLACGAVARDGQNYEFTEFVETVNFIVFRDWPLLVTFASFLYRKTTNFWL